MKLIVGLGNIGKEYQKTRHNIGFEILDNYLQDIKWSKNSFGLYYKTQNEIFLKPTTYMNLSGNAVRYFIDYFKINLNDILIIHDDMDLEAGTYKLKKQSSSGGHKGINSIIETLGTNNFLRLKIGISRSEKNDTINYVLGTFNEKEWKLIFEKLDTINKIILDFTLDNTAETLMNKYN